MTDRNEAPERIWAWRYNDPWGNELRWFEWEDHDPRPADTEYVRADLYAALEAKLLKATEALEEIKRQFSDIPNGHMAAVISRAALAEIKALGGGDE